MTRRTHEILENVLDVHGEIVLPARGISMGGKWAHADALVLEVWDRRKSPVGRVAVYRAGSGLVAHRIVRGAMREGKRWFITKGDGAITPDRIPIREDAVVGLVTAYRQGERIIALKGLNAGLCAAVHLVIGFTGSFVWRPIWEIGPV